MQLELNLNKKYYFRFITLAAILFHLNCQHLENVNVKSKCCTL